MRSTLYFRVRDLCASKVRSSWPRLARYSIAKEVPPLVTGKESILALKRENMPEQSFQWRAFYDSTMGSEGGVGAISTDPAFFTIPLDDHGYNRGHAVFDTCNVMNGRAFGLNFHLNRLLKSCELARIEHTYSKEWLKTVILHTIAASKKRDNVFVRYWITSGRGDFGIVPSETTSNARFYCVVRLRYEKTKQKEVGVKEVFVEISSKPKLLAMSNRTIICSTLSYVAGKEIGGDLGIALDSWYIQEVASQTLLWLLRIKC